jgi:predicted RNase H-like HicB family nuclease
MEQELEQEIDFELAIDYDDDMAKGISLTNKYHGIKLPIAVKKGEDGFYVAECPLFHGCHIQGKTVQDALKNIREVIYMVLEEKGNREIVESYRPKEVGWRAVTL